MSVNAFGTRLREARRKAGLTQKELAMRAGTTAETISRHERSDFGDVGADLASRLAHELEVDRDWLLGEPLFQEHGEVSPPYFDEFCVKYARIDELTAGDLDRIRGYYSPEFEITSWRDWASLAGWILDRRLPNQKDAD